MQVQVFTQLIIFALLIEAIVQTVKPIWKPEERTASYFVSLGVGMAISMGLNYLAGLDIFSAAGVPLAKAPIVAVIATGLILSRGSNFVHDLAKAILSVKDMLKDATGKAAQ